MKQICKANEQDISLGEVGLSRKSGKRSYETTSNTVVETASASPILAASITTAKIQSVGQELGPVYDMSNEKDENTGKTFSHEWDAGDPTL